MIIRFKSVLFKIILITAVLSIISNIALADPDPETVWIAPVGGVYYGDGYPEWIKESYVLTTTMSTTVSFDIEVHNDNNKSSPDDLLLDIWINDPSYMSYISGITVDGNSTSGWYPGEHQGVNGAYRNYTVGSIGAHSVKTLGITVVFSGDVPADFRMHFDAHNFHWQTKHGATVTSTVPAPRVVQIGIDQPEYMQSQDQFYVNITIDPQGIAISAVQYDLYYNTSAVWAEWANPGPFLKQNGADARIIFCEIYNEYDVGNKVGRITYVETISGSDGNLSSVNIPGTITTICLSAIGEPNASSHLNFGDVKISDPNKLDVPYCSVTICDNKVPVAIAISKYWVSNVASRFQCEAVLYACNSHGGGDMGKGENITYLRWDFGDGQYGISGGLEDCQKKHRYTTWKWNGTGYDPFIAYLTVRDGGCPPKSDTTSVPVTVYIAGDTNGDGIVDIYDVASVGKYWGQRADDGPCCNRYWTEKQADEADLNNDNVVDIIDAMIVGTNWNRLAYPPYVFP